MSKPSFTAFMKERAKRIKNAVTKRELLLAQTGIFKMPKQHRKRKKL